MGAQLCSRGIAAFSALEDAVTIAAEDACSECSELDDFDNFLGAADATPLPEDAPHQLNPFAQPLVSAQIKNRRKVRY